MLYGAVRIVHGEIGERFSPELSEKSRRHTRESRPTVNGSIGGFDRAMFTTMKHGSDSLGDPPVLTYRPSTTDFSARYSRGIVAYKQRQRQRSARSRMRSTLPASTSRTDTPQQRLLFFGNAHGFCIHRPVNPYAFHGRGQREREILPGQCDREIRVDAILLILLIKLHCSTNFYFQQICQIFHVPSKYCGAQVLQEVFLS